MQEVAGESWWGRYGRKWRKAVETWERMEQRNRNPPKVTFLAQGLLSSFLTAEYVRFWPWTWGASTEMQGEHEELGSRKIVPRCASTKKNIRMSATSCEPWPWSGVPLRRCVPFTFWINPTWFQSTCQMLRHTSYVHLVCMVMKAGLWLVIPCRSLSIGVVKSPHCKKIYSFAKFASLFNCVFAVIVLRFAWHRSTVIDLLVSLLCVKPSNPSMYGKLSEGFGSS